MWWWGDDCDVVLKSFEQPTYDQQVQNKSIYHSNQALLYHANWIKVLKPPLVKSIFCFGIPYSLGLEHHCFDITAPWTAMHIVGFFWHDERLAKTQRATTENIEQQGMLITAPEKNNTVCFTIRQLQ